MADNNSTRNTQMLEHLTDLLHTRHLEFTEGELEAIIEEELED